ncbi:MAG: translation initiation factor eIF-2B [Patescibacteria group bacterium]|nr:translation initiation factor eIF-2B [Patescibacteria group bacterium]
MKLPEEIKRIIKDIEDIKIQGATAVAESSFEGIKIFIREYDDLEKPVEVFLSEVEKVGLQLVNARPNEPLARNGLKYLLNTYRITNPNVKKVTEAREGLIKVMDQFINLLAGAKSRIVEVGTKEFASLNNVLTHCHSSTVENVFKGIAEQKTDVAQKTTTKKSPKQDTNHFRVVATETRPRYQGRITTKNLVEAGLDVTMITDSAVTSFLAGNWGMPIDAVFVGCDEIMFHGDMINKIGSYGICLSSYYTNKPVYVVGTLLKLDPSTVYDTPKIEMRDAHEVWPEAPDGLNIINPAFEIVPHEFVTGFVTEFGVIKPADVEKKLGEHYDWMW